MRYLFSGPDFIYANAFFPNAVTYILGGLEPVGEVPDILALPAAARDHALACVRASYDHFENYGVFLTTELEASGRECEFKGNLPLLLIGLVHAGKSIRTIELVEIDRSSALLELSGSHGKENVQGVKIEFLDQGGAVRTLYYFSVDLSDGGARVGGFLKFASQFGNGVSLLKAASYLLHDATFSQTRNFLLNYSTTIVQDDTGIPLKYFNTESWLLHSFGMLTEPPSGRFNPTIRATFGNCSAPNQSRPLEFGFGYAWRSEYANLLLAERKN